MLKTTVIGYLGADALVQNSNGKEFTTIRVAHTSKWTDASGTVHEETTWVDCIMNGAGKVNEFLKKGQLVYVSGSTSLRVYSSAKDRCMKAGLTINVQSIELLGAKSDDMPTVLYRKDTGEEVKVKRFYHSEQCVQARDTDPATALVSKNGKEYQASATGWITAVQNEHANE